MMFGITKLVCLLTKQAYCINKKCLAKDERSSLFYRSINNREKGLGCWMLGQIYKTLFMANDVRDREASVFND
jgi:hypothetical protein